MKILITGAKGFVGKNLIAELRNQGFSNLLEYDVDTDPTDLEKYTRDCEFVFHLAGVNRPKEQSEFYVG
jgi:UDP-2-acetamido-2,6-beta-L-arabino-hexul-4-ose reductase